MKNIHVNIAIQELENGFCVLSVGDSRRFSDYALICSNPVGAKDFASAQSMVMRLVREEIKKQRAKPEPKGTAP